MNHHIIVFMLLSALIGHEVVESALFDDSMDFEDGKLAALSELPLERLILLKQRLKHGTRSRNGNVSSSEDYDFRFPFPTLDKDKEDDTRKPLLPRTYEDYGGYEHHHHSPPPWKSIKTAKKDVQTIFQTTVTILAFLAFGAYLICLVLTTTRGNTAAAAMIIQQNQSSTTTTTRTKRGAGLAKLELEEAVFAMNLIAEGYTKYHGL